MNESIALFSKYPIKSIFLGFLVDVIGIIFILDLLPPGLKYSQYHNIIMFIICSNTSLFFYYCSYKGFTKKSNDVSLD